MNLWYFLSEGGTEGVPDHYRAEFWREVTYYNLRRIRPFLVLLLMLYPTLIYVVNIRNELGLNESDRVLVLQMHLLLLSSAVLFLVLILVRPAHSPATITRYHSNTLKFFAFAKIISGIVFMYVIAITKGHPIFFYFATVVWVSSLLIPPRASIVLFLVLLGALWTVLVLFVPQSSGKSFAVEGYLGSGGATAMLIIWNALLFRRSVEEFLQRKLVEEERNKIAQLNAELAVAYEEADTLNRELKERQDVLEQQAVEIELINTKLQEQNQMLVELNNEKDEFLGIAAHDLKNPLNGIRGLAEMLQMNGDEFAPTERAQFLDSIVSSSERMFGLIKNLLDVNALERQGLQLHPVTFDVSTIALMSTDNHRHRAEQKHITLHFATSGTTTVVADEQAVTQVLDNLVSNAVKYSPQGRNVFVEVKEQGTGNKEQGTGNKEQDGRSVPCCLILVRDEGPGISAEDQKKLFGKFARLSAQPTGGEHSTGLGLSIVKKLVEAMNGRVWCESELGKGATFIVELPKA
jgi:signal transduction histidine kinase